MWIKNYYTTHGSKMVGSVMNKVESVECFTWLYHTQNYIKLGGEMW